jgi:threonine dehydrogenase-like Zn-dependent dehydrogenase
VFNGVERVAVESVADPQIADPLDVIIKVDRAAICGSDLHPYYGREKGLDPGTIMGHEAVGTVIEVGSKVKSKKVGDQVFSPFSTSCGECHLCRIGLTSRCVLGKLFGFRAQGDGLHGLQAEYARIPLGESTLRCIPETVPRELALLLGDVLATGSFAIDLLGLADKDTPLAVIGTGAVGLMAVAYAKIRGYTRIFAIDAVPERLKLAKNFGADVIDFEAQPPLEFFHEETQGQGLAAIVEAVGSRSSQKLAIDLIRPGGTIATVGVHTDSYAFTPGQAYDKNLTYKTGRCPARYYMDILPSLLEGSIIPITDVITHRFPLSAGANAYDIFSKKKDGCIKAAFDFG